MFATIAGPQNANLGRLWSDVIPFRGDGLVSALRYGGLNSLDSNLYITMSEQAFHTLSPCEEYQPLSSRLQDAQDFTPQADSTQNL